MSAHLSAVDPSDYCRDCDDFHPGECDSVAKLFDPEHNRGFNPPAVAERIRRKLPLRMHEVTGDTWSYRDGFWRRDKRAVQRLLASSAGRQYRAPMHKSTVHDRVLAELENEGEFVDPSDPDQDHIALPSAGLFHIPTGEVVDHDPSVMTYYTTAVDPEFDVPTPQLDRFLDLVLPQEEHERFLDALAYALTPTNWRNYAFLFIGDGGNGKSRALSLLRALVDKRSRSAMSLRRLEAQFATSNLYGKQLNICAETSARHLSESETFKLVTGGDEVFVEYKGRDGFEGRIHTKLFFAANDIPTLSDTGASMDRRWQIFEFPNKLSWTPEDEAALHAEAPAILGRLLWRLAGEHEFDIRHTEASSRAKARMRFDSDLVVQWWGDQFDRYSPGNFLDRTAAYDAFSAWAEESGYVKGRYPKRPTFCKRLRSLFGRDEIKRHGSAGRGWVMTEHDCIDPKSAADTPKGAADPKSAAKVPRPETAGQGADSGSESTECGTAAPFSTNQIYMSDPEEERVHDTLTPDEQAQIKAELDGGHICYGSFREGDFEGCVRCWGSIGAAARAEVARLCPER